MAERQFVIVIRNETKGSGVGDDVGGPGGLEGNKKQEQEKKDWTDVVGSKFKRFASIGGTYAFVKSTVDTIVTHNNSLIEIQTGSKEAQARATFVYNNVSSLANAVVGGAMAGSFAGPAGAVAGAVIGTVTHVFGKLINYSLETDRISKQRNVEETQNFLATSQRVTVTGSRYMSAANGG